MPKVSLKPELQILGNKVWELFFCKLCSCQFDIMRNNDSANHFQPAKCKQNLELLKAAFTFLVHTIFSLQPVAGEKPQVKSIELVQNLQEKLTFEPIAEKLKTVFKSYDKMKKIAKALQESEEDFLRGRIQTPL